MKANASIISGPSPDIFGDSDDNEFDYFKPKKLKNMITANSMLMNEVPSLPKTT